MKNITVSVTDEVYHRARIQAAQQSTSVSAMVRKALNSLSSEETEFERLAREEKEIVDRIRRQGRVFSAGDRISRDALHDRDALR